MSMNIKEQKERGKRDAARGFTLIEIIVAVGLFAIVMLMATGAYLVLISVDRTAQATAVATDNLAFALESMTRAIRTGTGYACGAGGDCFGTPGSSITFTDADGNIVTFARAAGASCGSSDPNSGCILETINGAATVLTDPSVNVSTLKFYVFGTAQGAADYSQPQVTLSIAGCVSAGSNNTCASGKGAQFTIETGATMRGVDL